MVVFTLKTDVDALSVTPSYTVSATCEPYASGIEGGDAFATVIRHDAVIDEPRPLAPCDYPGLLGVLQVWYKHAVAKLPCWKGHSPDTRVYTGTTWTTYCASDKQDRHLGYSSNTNGILPHCWVEACGVNLDKEGCKLPGPGGVVVGREG